jgi:hypothetical protein
MRSSNIFDFQHPKDIRIITNILVVIQQFVLGLQFRENALNFNPEQTHQRSTMHSYVCFVFSLLQPRELGFYVLQLFLLLM